MRALTPVAVDAAAGGLALLPRLAAATAGTGPALLPHAAGHAAPEHDPSAALPSGAALVVGTSGSTGRPKLAVLTADALAASAAATHDALGGPGHWLLALPAHHIAGLQVLLRSLAAGTTPVALPPGPFTPAAFAAAAARTDSGGRRYVSLVPTQVRRLLADPAGRDALALFDAVLVGGAASDAALLERGRAAGARLVTTYGMSETGGGCIYDHRPLPGVRVRVGDQGRIELGGPTLAWGYLGDPDRTAAAFTTDDGHRWFRTDDLGECRDGVLTVLGRADDVIVTGGLKVAPAVVEAAVARHLPGVEAVAVGLPDPEWGHVVALAATGPLPPLPRLRDTLRAALPAAALPRVAGRLDALPMRGPGKPDRAAVARLLASRRAADVGE